MRKMKNSGIEWIGDVPEGWGIARFKNFVDSVNTGLSITKEYWDTNGDLMLYTAGQTPIKANYTNFPEELLTTSNDILVARNGAGAVQIPELKSIYTDHVIRFVIKSMINRKYVYYTLLNCVERIANEANDVSLKTLSKSTWEIQEFVVPTLAEQTAIANFLDDKCGKIDSLIEIEENLISELKEYKKGIIQKAVTKGISNAKLKDSGIEWIGEVPDHWSICRIKNIFSIQSGNGFPVEEQGRSNGDLPFLKNSDINGRDFFINSGNNYVNYGDVERLKLNIIPKLSIIMGKIGESLKKIIGRLTYANV